MSHFFARFPRKRRLAQALVAVDFFAVPSATFRVLYVFLVLAHERRKILHFNISQAPSALWTAQQVVEAFPYTTSRRVICSGIEMESMALILCAESRAWAWSKSSSPLDRRGRIHMLNA